MRNFQVYKWKIAYTKDFNAWRILIIFYMYIFRLGGGGGV